MYRLPDQSSKDIEIFALTLGHLEKWLDQKDKVNFKIYDVTTWEINNCHTPIINISQSKSNQKMKFGQITEYKMRNIFLEKSYTKYSGETIPISFLKNHSWAYLWISSLKFYAVSLWYFKLRVIEIYWNYAPGHFPSPHTNLFKKQIEVWNYSPYHIFCMFLEKNIFLVIFYQQTKFDCLVVFTSWDIGQ